VKPAPTGTEAGGAALAGLTDENSPTATTIVDIAAIAFLIGNRLNALLIV
jgi:hypothetical protein